MRISYGWMLGYLLGLGNISFDLKATFGPLPAEGLFNWLEGYAVTFVLMAASMLISSSIVSAATHHRS